MTDIVALKAAIEKAQANPGLGRSALVRRLFDYLAESSLAGRSPKEAEVAIEVFGRQPDFDPARDAVARVYVHKLRRRLEQIDLGDGFGLTIPRGEYRLALRGAAPMSAEPTSAATQPARKRIGILAAVAALAAAGGWVGSMAVHDLLPPLASRAPTNSPVWGAFAAQDRPTILVVGDFFIFADIDQEDGSERLVREYTVNSPADLDQFIRDHPVRAEGYMDLGLKYLPIGSASAITRVMRALGAKTDVRVMPVSSLTPPLIRDSNIIYVGYLSGLGVLRDATFAGSRYAIGETYDDIIDTRTKQRFESGGGGRHPGGTMYADYGYISTFAGPSGNRIMIIAGTRDAALMEMGQTVLNPAALDALARAGGTIGSAESLYGINGMDQVNVDSRLIRSSPINQAAIWRDGSGGRRTFPAG